MNFSSKQDSQKPRTGYPSKRWWVIDGDLVFLMMFRHTLNNEISHQSVRTFSDPIKALINLCSLDDDECPDYVLLQLENSKLEAHKFVEYYFSNIHHKNVPAFYVMTKKDPKSLDPHILKNERIKRIYNRPLAPHEFEHVIMSTLNPLSISQNIRKLA